jgi:hypothetical protein
VAEKSERAPTPADRAVTTSPYHKLADVLRRLRQLTTKARRENASSFGKIKALTSEWDTADALARNTSAARGIPFAAFDPAISEAKTLVIELAQVAAGDATVPFDPLDTKYAEAERRLEELGETYAGVSGEPEPRMEQNPVNPPGYITLSRSAQPILGFLDAANAAISREYARVAKLHCYDAKSKGAHEEWERLRRDHEQLILQLGALGAAAIRAGALAHEASRTGELIRKVKDCVRKSLGWISTWWERHGGDYRAWRARGLTDREGGLVPESGQGADMPPELADEALALLRPSSDTLCELTNQLHDIAIGVPGADAGPAGVLDALFVAAAAQQRQREEAATAENERAQRLQEHKDLRDQLAAALDRAYRFPNEENEQGRKPLPEGLTRWAKRFTAVGELMRRCDRAIPSLGLIRRLRGVAAATAPLPMKLACALLVQASAGETEESASVLERSNSDPDLRRFVRWLPFVLDNLWHPYHPGSVSVSVAEPPPEATFEEYRQAGGAFGWRSASIVDEPAGPYRARATPEGSTARPEAEGAKEKAAAPPLAARVRAHDVAGDKKLQARNKWIYRQCCKGRSVPYANVLAELKRTAPGKGWEVIESIQGLRAAARNYAARNNLDPPPNRQDL